MLNYTEVEIENSIVLLSGGVYYKGCKRCGGTGHYSFNGYDSICYNCNNNASMRLGDELGTEADARKWAHKRELARLARIRKEERRVQALQDALDTKIAHMRISGMDDVVDYLLAVDMDTARGFIYDMASHVQWISMGEKIMTLNMVAAVRRSMERDAEKKADAEAHPVQEGRIVLTGEIVSTKVVDTDFGTAYKIVLKDDRGFKVYGTLPKSLADKFIDEFEAAPEHADAEGNFSYYTYGPACWFLGTDGTDETGVKGKRITFTATVEASNEDKGFGFYSRPTKASIVEGE